VLENREVVNEVVCMVQKEVANRIASPPGNKVYGILSVLIGAFYDIEFLRTVPPQVFYPVPKVHSAVIRLRRNGRNQLPCREEVFFKIVKQGFQNRRKTLRNALKSLNLPEQILALRVSI
jgi:16S rRNA (adenine1518-N6/adenine1519-N6)-dimethyltransferase